MKDWEHEHRLENEFGTSLADYMDNKLTDEKRNELCADKPVEQTAMQKTAGTNEVPAF